jgi:hypothetical protein
LRAEGSEHEAGGTVNGSMTVRRFIRYASWLLATLVVLSGVAAAVLNTLGGPVERTGSIAVALVVATAILLVAHQPLGSLSLLTVLLLVAAFAVPIFLVPLAPDTSVCQNVRTPCDPPLNGNIEIRLALLVTLLAAALVTAVMGYARSRRT